MAHEILNGKPYTYLDDAPLEERRTRAVTMRRSLPESPRDLGALDPDAIERVRDEAWPSPATPKRRTTPCSASSSVPEADAAPLARLVDELVATGRAATAA